MKNIKIESKSFTLNTWFMAALSIIIGILFVSFPDSLLIAVGYIVAVLCIAFGVYHVVSYLFNKTSQYTENLLAFGLVFLSIGLYILFVPTFPVSIAPFFFGIIILISSFIQLQYSIDLKKLGYKYWLHMFIVSIISCVFGIIIMINPFSTQVLLIIMIGVALIASGIATLISNILLKRTGHKVK